VPIVKGIDPPQALFQVDKRRVFGLSINMHSLIAQRKRRVALMGNFDSDYYLHPRSVNEELDFAQRIFERGGFTVVDVTNKPIESTANEIINFVQRNFDCEEQKVHKNLGELPDGYTIGSGI
jgi:regulator of PEP synthase PpsR (kinase-PPPase family)